MSADELALTTDAELTRKAIAAASAAQATVARLLAGEALSEAQLAARADAVAGQLWAAHFLLGAAATVATAANDATVTATWAAAEGDRMCDDCGARDGKSFPISDLPWMPGDGSTACGGNCRCSWVFSVTAKARARVPARRQQSKTPVSRARPS